MEPITIQEFADRLAEIMDAVSKEFSQQQTNELHKGKINVPQFLILNYLLENKESKMKELSRVINLTGAATTGIVDRLVSSNYVVRSFDPNDRRVIKVRLTAKGKGLICRVYEERKKVIMRLFQKVSESDRGEYLRILTQINDTLNKESNLS
jgi:MarR family 2-MHQ and catechol resistance regulon transcriptional repressor